jgi:hypothetical protein
MWKAQHVLIMQACLGPFLCQTPDNFGPLLPNESSRLGFVHHDVHRSENNFDLYGMRQQLVPAQEVSPQN